jgi:hypothetical protein
VGLAGYGLHACLSFNPAPEGQVRLIQGQMVRLMLHNVLTTE